MTERQTEIVADIITERQNQDAKWGSDRHHDWGTWKLILDEEDGEVATEMLNNRFGPVNDHAIPELRAELVQMAAVIVAILEQIDREFPRD